jgi:hypothetical protein
MSDTDKAPREWAFAKYNVKAEMFLAGREGFKAGASHERSRPLTSDEAEELAREACRLMAETDTLEAHGHAILSELRRLRGRKG